MKSLQTGTFLDFDEQLSLLKQKDRYRVLNSVEKVKPAELKWNGKRYVNLASNDYLGMSGRITVKWASAYATLKYSAGAGASRLMSGNSSLYDILERQIAEFKQTESAIVYPTGYMANIGVLSSVLDSGDLVVLDRACHASLVQGAKLSGAKLWVYPHHDMAALENLLERAKGEAFSKVIVVTESLFSMDGDIVPLPELLRICKKYGALIMLDEAHATGVLGEKGRGACEHFNLPAGQIDILMGTLSKAIGSLGGFVAGKRDLIEYLKNKSKPFIYTTALPPSCLSASIQAFKLLRKSAAPVMQLNANVQLLSEGLKNTGIRISKNLTPIFPVVFGTDSETLKAGKVFLEAGIYAPAVRPPTVPENESRLRLSVTASHTKKQIERVIAAAQKTKEFRV